MVNKKKKRTFPEQAQENNNTSEGFGVGGWTPDQQVGRAMSSTFVSTSQGTPAAAVPPTATLPTNALADVTNAANPIPTNAALLPSSTTTTFTTNTVTPNPNPLVAAKMLQQQQFATSQKPIVEDTDIWKLKDLGNLASAIRTAGNNNPSLNPNNNQLDASNSNGQGDGGGGSVLGTSVFGKVYFYLNDVSNPFKVTSRFTALASMGGFSSKKASAESPAKGDQNAEDTKITIESIDAEIQHYLPGVFIVRLLDRFVLLPTEESSALLKDMKKFQKKNAALTRNDAFDTFGMREHADAMIRILYNEPLDFFMAYQNFQFFGKQDEKYRYQFIDKMVKENLILVMDLDSAGSTRKRDIFITCPFSRLLKEATDIKLKLPLTEVQISKHIKEYSVHIDPVDSRLHTLFATYRYAEACKRKRSAVFEASRIEDFVGGDIEAERLAQDFFSTATVNILILSIINKVFITRDTIYGGGGAPAGAIGAGGRQKIKEQNASDLLKTWHIADLQSKGIITRFCALHSKSLRGMKKLAASVFKMVSPTQIREYFGEEVGFYFAWLEFYNEWCVIMVVPGLCSAGWSFLFNHFSSTSSFSDYLSAFDNSSAIWFAFTLNLASLLFLKFWKRRNNYLSFLWDVDQHSENLYADLRSGWKPSEKLQYSPINGEMIPWETARSRLIRRSVALFVLIVCVILLILIIAGNVALLAYISEYGKLGVSFVDDYGSDADSAVTSAVTAVLIITVGGAIDRVTLYLVNLANHRTLNSHLQHYIWMQFLIQFLNSYGLMIFSAVVRPILDRSYPGLKYFFGPLSCLNQGDGDTCMRSLVLSVSIIFVLKQLFQQWVGWSKNFVIRRAQGVREPFYIYPYQSDKQLSTVTVESFEKEYNSKIIQLGYMVLFSAAFPFGPVLALINNYFEMNLNVNQYLFEYNRPFVVRATGIGPWEKIIGTLVYLGIIINGLSLPFISDGFYYLMQFFYTRNYLDQTYFSYHQIVFVILYEHTLFICASIIDVMIEDVPESVRVGRLAEKHIGAERKNNIPVVAPTSTGIEKANGGNSLTGGVVKSAQIIQTPEESPQKKTMRSF